MNIQLKQDALVFSHVTIFRNGIESIVVMKGYLQINMLRGCARYIYKKDTINNIKFRSLCEMKLYIDSYFL